MTSSFPKFSPARLSHLISSSFFPPRSLRSSHLLCLGSFKVLFPGFHLHSCPSSLPSQNPTESFLKYNLTTALTSLLQTCKCMRFSPPPMAWLLHASPPLPPLSVVSNSTAHNTNLQCFCLYVPSPGTCSQGSEIPFYSSISQFLKLA